MSIFAIVDKSLRPHTFPSLKGLKGNGTYKGKYSPDGTGTFDSEGEYQVPGPAQP